MAVPDHIRSETAEQEIITLASSFSHLRHDFNDCGSVHPYATHIDFHIIDLERGFKHVPTSGYLDICVSGQFRETPPMTYRAFFEELDSFLEERDLHLWKGDTVFLKQGKPYAVLMLTQKGKIPLAVGGHDLIGTCDTYLGGSHFLFERDPERSGFYAACAAISDIGADGGSPLYLALKLVNPPNEDYSTRFKTGVKKAAEFTHTPHVDIKVDHYDEALGEMAAVLAVLGSVPCGRRMTLRGLEKGMGVYIAGTVGGAAAHGYDLPEEILKTNLDPEFRAGVFEAVTMPAVCNDVSDGIEKSVRNLLRYARGLDIELSERALLDAAYCDTVTLDNVLFGGDDYALLIATHKNLSLLKDVTLVGKTRPGKGHVVYTQ